MTQSRNILPPKRFWTDAERDLLRERYATTRTADLAALLDRPVGSVHQHANKLGLFKSPELLSAMTREAMSKPEHPGRLAQFKPGQVPPNKGLRRPGWAPGNMASTQFKPGIKPHTWVPVGSHRVNADGYLDRKVNDLPGPGTVRWKPVHRLVWEAANGPIPDGHTVVFKPGRRTAELDKINLDAIECISRADLMKRNTYHNLPKPLAELVQLRGVLNRQINRKAKEAETT